MRALLLLAPLALLAGCPPAGDCVNDEDCDTAEGCHRGLGVKGSVVIDAGRHSLRARFVDMNGAVLDEYTINR